MEHPSSEIEGIIYKLTTGSPRLQQQTLGYYFTPNASFSHPFCAVNGNRDQILSIFRWYKILSPKIEIQVNGISYEEARQKLYVDISQTFRLWPLIPLGYRANVNLVTVLQLTRDQSGRDKAAEKPISQNGATPSYGSNALSAADTSPFTRGGTEKPVPTLPSTSEPARYWIKSQTDLYQTTEFAKFASITGLLPLIFSLWHIFATYCCVLGALIFAPLSNALQSYSDKQVEHRARVRGNPAFGPNFGGDGTAEGRAREKQRDIWELEARFVSGGKEDVGKVEGLKKKMKTTLKMEPKGGGKQNLGGVDQEPMLDWMKMEQSAH